MLYFSEPLNIFFPPRHLNAELLRLILKFLTVFRIDRNHQHFSFYLKNTICGLFVYCQSYFLLLSKHFVGCLHYREAGNREILMPSCLALMDLEKVVDLDTWKMEKVSTIIKEKGWIHRYQFLENLTAHFNAVRQSLTTLSYPSYQEQFSLTPFVDHTPIFTYFWASYQPLPLVNEHPIIKLKRIVNYRLKT